MSGSQYKKEDASWGMLLKGRNSLKSLALAGGVALHAINVYITITTLPSIVRDIGGLIYMHGIPPFLFWHPFSLQR